MEDQKTAICPYCGEVCDYDLDEEIAHMVGKHPEIIEKRMLEAGFRKVDGKWIDRLVEPY